MNSLNKKKMGKEMRMNIQIGDYEVDSVILDLNLRCQYSDKADMVEYGEPIANLVPCAAAIG